MSAEKEKVNSGAKDFFVSRLRKYKYLLLMLAILIAFIPKVLAVENEVGMRVVITSIGIDKSDVGYQVSAQVFIPDSSDIKSQSKSVISASAGTVGEAVELLSLKTGRISNIAHCRLIVLGSEVVEDDALSPLDYFLRNGQVNWSCMLTCSPSDAKSTLDAINMLEESANFSWQKYLISANMSALSLTTDLKRFMDDSYDTARTSYLAVLDVKPVSEKQEKTNEGGEGGSGEGSGGGEGQLKSEISEERRTVIIKNGVKVGEIGIEEMRGVNWIDKRSKNSLFTVSGIGGEFFSDAPVTVNLKDKKIRVSTTFVDGKPIVKVKMKTTIEELEIMRKIIPTSLTDIQRKEYYDALKEKISQKVQEEIAIALNKSIEFDADFMRLNSRFRRYNPYKYREYSASHSLSDLLKDVEFQFEIDCRVVM